MTRVRRVLACGAIASALVLGPPGSANADLNIPTPGGEEWHESFEELELRLEVAVCLFFRGNCGLIPPPPPDGSEEPQPPEPPGPS